MKICSKCDILKPFDDFHLDANGKYGRKSRCKKCIKQIDSDQYKRDRDKELQNCKNWRKNNKNKIKLRHQRWTKENPQYYTNYYKENKERLYKIGYENEKYKIKTDINFKLRKRLRARLFGAIKDNYKSGSAVRDLGCTIDELKIYLSIFFYNNPETNDPMTWDNYGYYGWHIDHIKPLVSFNLQNREELLKAVHFTNLQPLWKKDNFDKFDKIVDSV